HHSRRDGSNIEPCVLEGVRPVPRRFEFMISLLRPLSLGSAKPAGATAASSSYRWWAAVVAALALLSAATIARPIGVEAASLNVSWQAPTTNADGTRLTTLFGYRLYFGTSTPVCQGPS